VYGMAMKLQPSVMDLDIDKSTRRADIVIYREGEPKSNIMVIP
jgi:hypothetical protein